MESSIDKSRSRVDLLRDFVIVVVVGYFTYNFGYFQNSICYLLVVSHIQPLARAV